MCQLTINNIGGINCYVNIAIFSLLFVPKSKQVHQFVNDVEFSKTSLQFY